MRRELVAYIATWVLALAISITGICLLAQRTVVVWDDVIGEPNVGESRTVPVDHIGLALLVVGLVLLGAILLLEALGKFRRG